MSQEEFNLVISADKSFGDAARELLEYRELFYILAWRDFKVRYKQTVIGALWALLRPLLTMVVFTIIFGKIAGLEYKTAHDTRAIPLQRHQSFCRH